MRAPKRKSYHLPILLEQDEDGVYIVSCPSFKGCHSFGKTPDEAMANIKEVIEMCLEETEPSSLNKFIGFRELEFEAK
jgi:predicted RNase H-like HicB family nuclease